MEELTKSPASVISTIFEWLGVDSTYIPGNLDRVENAAPDTFQKATGLGVLYRIRNSRTYDLLQGVVPKDVKRWARERMTSTATRDNEERDACVAHLRPILQRKTHALEGLLDRHFPEWKTLWGQT
jgi:hypothetical protein